MAVMRAAALTTGPMYSTRRVIGSRTMRGRAHVHAHPHAQALEQHAVVGVAPLLGRARVLEQRLGPLDLEQRLLRLGAPVQRVVGVLEGHAERALAAVAVADEHHLVAAVLLEQRAQGLVVEQRGVAHGLGVELPERGGARDVGEHDRHLALGRAHPTRCASVCRCRRCSPCATHHKASE